MKYHAIAGFLVQYRELIALNLVCYIVPWILFYRLHREGKAKIAPFVIAKVLGGTLLYVVAVIWTDFRHQPDFTFRYCIYCSRAFSTYSYRLAPFVAAIALLAAWADGRYLSEKRPVREQLKQTVTA